MPKQTRLGFHCSHEQHPPSLLLQHAAWAAEAGFTEAMCSDHFHPWSERQGHSGFTWSWLGAALERTSLSFGTVCAPGQRYHPAIVAQAAATLTEMYPDRCWLAVGSGEALNEAITGQPWPPKPERNHRLKACVDTMRALWAGETVSAEGQPATKNARVYSRPPRPPLLLGAAISAETARWVGSWADGLITVAGSRDDMRQVVDAFREGGGASKPMFLQVALAFAPTDDAAKEAAYDQWRHCALPANSLADIATAREFDLACAGAGRGDVLSKVRASADIERHKDWLHADAEFGFDRIYLHNVARAHQRGFIDACGERLLPEFARVDA